MKHLTPYYAAPILLCFGCFLHAEANQNESLRPSVLDTFYPQLQNGDNLWISADLLYLLPDEKSIAMANKETNLFTTADVTEEPVVHPHFDWEFGFRLGFGYIFSKRAWDMAVNWMRFTADSEQERDNNNDIEFGMFPIWSLGDDILPFDWVAEANMRWDLDLNLVDLDFGRDFAFGKLFFLRPFAGLRTAWIDQEINVTYKGGIFANGLDLPGLGSDCRADHVDMRNNYWGIGPRVGIQPQLNLGKGLRLYGSASGTFQYGLFDVRQREVLLQTVRFDEKRHPREFRWMLDASGGIMWKTFFAKDRFALTFGLGWEYHIFFHQIELEGDEFGLVSDNCDLILNGVTFSSRFDF